MKSGEPSFRIHVLGAYLYGAALVIAGSAAVFRYHGLKVIELIRESHISSMTPVNPMTGFVEAGTIGLFLAVLGAATLLLTFLSRTFRGARTSDFVLIALVNVFSAFYFMNAYVCDDAFITFRTVDNFIHGYGLRWNTLERVQTFTNPLWMFAVSVPYGAVYGLLPLDDVTKMYHVSMFLSYLVSLAALLYLAARFIREKRGGALLVLLGFLFSSRAFVEYTSSGLENPLSYLLIALFHTRFLSDTDHANPRHLLFYFLTASLAFVNRMDSILLYAAPVAWLCAVGWKEHGPKMIRIGLTGFLPAYGWVFFSLVYYGFPFPNSYYAKLGVGSAGVALKQGVNFLFSILVTDPVTVAVLLAAPLVPVIRRDSRFLLVSGSIVLSLGYIVSTGGDFMGGRFASVPFLAAAILLAYCIPRRKVAVPAVELPPRGKGKPEKNASRTDLRSRYGIPVATVIVFAAYNAAAPLSPVKTPWQAGYFSGHPGGAQLFHLPDSLENIYQNVDYYYSSNPLFYSRGEFPFGNVKYHKVNNCLHCRSLREGREPALIEGGGIVGFCRGPRHQLIDPQIITDPLLVRLPNPDFSRGFIPGHFTKPAPAGLLESHALGRNCIRDAGLRPYYERIRTVTRGKLFTKERIMNIFELNCTGARKYAKPYS